MAKNKVTGFFWAWCLNKKCGKWSIEICKISQNYDGFEKIAKTAKKTYWRQKKNWRTDGQTDGQRQI